MTVKALDAIEVKKAYEAKLDESFKNAAVQNILQRLSVSGEYRGPIEAGGLFEDFVTEWGHKQDLVVEDLREERGLFVRRFASFDPTARWQVSKEIQNIYVSMNPIRLLVPVDVENIQRINEYLVEHGRVTVSPSSVTPEEFYAKYSVVEKLFAFGNLYENAGWDTTYNFKDDMINHSYVQIRLPA